MWQPDIEGDTRGRAELTEAYRNPPYDPPYDVARSAKNTVPPLMARAHGHRRKKDDGHRHPPASRHSSAHNNPKPVNK
jgi:hypothetical protein